MLKRFVIHYNQGLGDHIICNGLVRFLLNSWRPNLVLLPVKKKIYNSVRDMYGNEHSPLQIATYDESKISETAFVESISVGHSVPVLRLPANNKSPFDVQFYRHLNIPFSQRWAGFDRSRVCRANKLPIDIPERFALVATSGSFGEASIDISACIPIIRVRELTDSIFDWAPLITLAEQLHAIDSSFIHLADSLDLTGKKLFYYDIGRGSTFHLRHEWSRVPVTAR